jgi:hypothetical protein
LELIYAECKRERGGHAKYKFSFRSDDEIILYGEIHKRIYQFYLIIAYVDRLCGLVVRVSSYRSRGPGFDSRPYQIFSDNLNSRGSGTGSTQPRENN